MTTKVMGRGVDFSQASTRMIGDYSNSTITLRGLFQTTTANSQTAIGAVPNGTSTASSFYAANAADPSNAATVSMGITATEARLTTGYFGTGSYLPFQIFVGGAKRLEFGTNGAAVFSNSVQEKSVAMAANDIDLSLANYFTKTISGATTLTVSNVPASGTVGAFILELTNAGSAAVTMFSGVKWAGGTVPTFTAAGVDVIGFYTVNGGTTWRAMVLAKDIK